jgi:hypothetical protein
VNTIIALWSIPRSVSTAFERMMMERGDFKVIHEPFSYFFYAKEQAATAVGMNVDPKQPQDFEDILTMIKSEAENSPVFFKDMSYHAISRATQAFLDNFENTFIIRDPAITLISHYKLNPDFTLTEAGYEEQFKMFEMVNKATGKLPAIVDAEDLIQSPSTVIESYCQKVGIPYIPEALTWPAEFKSEWKTWEQWHLDAAESTGFTKDMETFDFTVQDIPRLTEMYTKCHPYYLELYQLRIQP